MMVELKAGPLELYMRPPRFRLLRPSTWRRKWRKVAVLERGPGLTFDGALSEAERDRFRAWLDASMPVRRRAIDLHLAALGIHRKEGGE